VIPGCLFNLFFGFFHPPAVYVIHPCRCSGCSRVLRSMPASLLFGYRLVAMASLVIVALSPGCWVHVPQRRASGCVICFHGHQPCDRRAHRRSRCFRLAPPPSGAAKLRAAMTPMLFCLGGLCKSRFAGVTAHHAGHGAVDIHVNNTYFCGGALFTNVNFMALHHGCRPAIYHLGSLNSHGKNCITRACGQAHFLLNLHRHNLNFLSRCTARADWHAPRVSSYDPEFRLLELCLPPQVPFCWGSRSSLPCSIWSASLGARKQARQNPWNRRSGLEWPAALATSGRELRRRTYHTVASAAPLRLRQRPSLVEHQRALSPGH